ncbi:hypothetical protein B0H14DRAFT_3897203 [Mycena olivaceomarginata]|nr:hypothetical protein B0H14DRAFT_3899324 [Mycena olivaceomarginata]KAJ7747875.1 hypothetical protein B0H14DRAFT_3897203 [Mycena olivaceomarginata]
MSSESLGGPRPHRLRRDVGIYSTGFIVTCNDMERISYSACDANFRSRYGNAVFALKWHVGKHKYEIFPLKSGDRTGLHLFAISFFPYLKDTSADEERFRRLGSLSAEQKDAWYELYGKHTGVALEDLNVHTMRYPTSGACATFLGDELQAVINANKELWEFLVPVALLPRIFTRKT